MNSPISSWTPPRFAFADGSKLFAVRMAVDDAGVLKLIAEGDCFVRLNHVRPTASFRLKQMGLAALQQKLETAAWTVWRETEEYLRFSALPFRCIEAYKLSSAKEVLLVFAISFSFRSQDTSTTQKIAEELLKDHEAQLAAWESELQRERQDLDNYLARNPHAEGTRAIEDLRIVREDNQGRPTLDAEKLLSRLPAAVVFRVRKNVSANALERAAIKAIADSEWAQSREGNYSGVAGISVDSHHMGLVTWAPYDGPPSYPEVRWTVQRRLPRALNKPRYSKVYRPQITESTQTSEQHIVDTAVGSDLLANIELIDDLQFDVDGHKERGAIVRDAIRELGFDAIAWYQSFHTYSEDTWGIYFDSRKLDDLALSFLDEFRGKGFFSPHVMAARLAFGLVYAHELFHARVEAALSWLEVNTLQPRYRRYKRQVYDSVQWTSSWLEEALANWEAWEWFRSNPVQSLFAKDGQKLNVLQSVVEDTLDLSPPGYREWRSGRDPMVWRRFATELTTARAAPSSRNRSLPLDTIIRGRQPYDLRHADIPIRFVGDGIVADRVQSAPACLNVPRKREVEKALKLFGHVLDTRGGKGSHEKWIGVDNRAFSLPSDDPVTRTVFKTFLRHLGIDKNKYIHEVRPKL